MHRLNAVVWFEPCAAAPSQVLYSFRFEQCATLSHSGSLLNFPECSTHRTHRPQSSSFLGLP